MKKRTTLTAASYREIYDLYWDENVDQYTLSNLYNIDQGYISRVVNNLRFPYQRQRALLFKKKKYVPNYTPSPKEPKQATTLRSKRLKLPNTKLTLTKANKMRDTWFRGEQTQQQLATKYGVNQSTVSKTIKGEKWKFKISP